MQILEFAGVALGLANQWLTIRQNIACWPVGIASVVLLAFVFHDAKLYSDVLLQAVYVVLQLYGWRLWARRRDGGGIAARSLVPVSLLTPIGWLVLAAVIAAGGALLGAAMGRFTDAALPYWDAATTVASLCAQWLQARKVLESWLVFIAANLSFIAIYLGKGLYATALLFVVISVLAAIGFAHWRASFRAQGTGR